MKIKIKSNISSIHFVTIWLFIIDFSLQGIIGGNGFHLFKNNYFVETGTYEGFGVLLALQAKFKHIISIEIDQNLYQSCKQKFSSYPHVDIYHGDSAIVLGKIIENISEPITFWLDGHNSSSIVLSKNTPILEELEQINNHPIKNHIILIDDIRCCNTAFFDFISRETIIKKIYAINPGYKVFFIDGFVARDILVAVPPDRIDIINQLKRIRR